jgi:hypothetical protein
MIRLAYDHLDGERMSEEIHEMPLYAMERIIGMEDTALPVHGLPCVRFQLFDDDGELYYSGALSDDDECENQTAALRWGEAMAGCTTVKVERNGKFVQEIS